MYDRQKIFWQKISERPDASEFENKEPFDVLVVGGGPAVPAAIWHEKVFTGITFEISGGQIKDTLVLRIISVKYYEGPKSRKKP